MKELWLMTDEEREECKTFAQWKGQGRSVNRGEKSVGRIHGVAVFHSSQTNVRQRRGGCGLALDMSYGDYDVDYYGLGPFD